MIIPKEFEQEFNSFPAVLQRLVLAEVEAGNSIAELFHGFPAAPCGACIRLTRPISSRTHGEAGELLFYDRDNSAYSGEFSDAQRHYFVLGPPRPPVTIAAHGVPYQNSGSSPQKSSVTTEGPTDPSSLPERFKASMVIDHEKWHDGVGYDVGLIAEASAEERRVIEDHLLQRGVRDWRDVEALAALGSLRAHSALRSAYLSGDAQVRMAMHTHAPELLPEAERTASLVQALEHAHFFSGLTAALSEVETYHPPEVINSLLRGLMEREGDVAFHFAAMLYFLNGKEFSPFNMEHRRFFLRFNTTDPVEREQVTRELCATLGIDPSRCARTKQNGPT